MGEKDVSDDRLAKSVSDAVGEVLRNERERIYAELTSDQALREDAKRKSALKAVLAVLASLGTAGWGSYELVVRPRETAEASRMQVIDRALHGDPAASDPDDKKGLAGRLNSAEQRIERLGDLHFDQRSLILDVRQELADKLDAVSPRARNVPPSESVEEAQRQVEAYRSRKRAKDADEALRKGDPFSGIQ